MRAGRKFNSSYRSKHLKKLQELIIVAELRTTVSFETPFSSLCEHGDLVEFFIIDVQEENVQNRKYKLATVECALSNDLSHTFFTRSHLGALLNPGDHAKGYFLKNANFNNPQWEEYTNRIQNSGHRQTHLGGGMPDVVLVRKSYPNARRKNRGRAWRLKKLAAEKEVEDWGKTKKEVGVEKAEKDYEIFLRDLEEDEELRGMVNLFKDDRAVVNDAGLVISTNVVDDDAMLETDGEEEEEDFPSIQVDELLDDLEALEITE